LPSDSPTATLPHAAETVQQSAAAPPRIPVPLPSVSGIAPHEDALMLADAFMRSLGVQGQLPDIAPAPAPTPSDVESNPEPIATAKRVSVSAAQVIAPLASAPVLSSAPASRRSSEPEGPPRPAVREKGHDSAAPARTVIETRHVVVERKISAGEDAGVCGGGAPRFGLGQL
jgi:hypothetical protein